MFVNDDSLKKYSGIYICIYFFFPLQIDPTLAKHREQLVIEVGRKLDKARMIRFEERTGYFSSTDLGRTASHYYIKYNTIEVLY